jgi:hypothetical protein
VRGIFLVMFAPQATSLSIVCMCQLMRFAFYVFLQSRAGLGQIDDHEVPIHFGLLYCVVL